MPRRNEPVWYEAAPDPRNRPSIDMLITKMRKLSNLQNKPEAVQFVINDMMHHYFIDEELRPARLWWIMESAMYKFMMITGESFPNEKMLLAGGVAHLAEATGANFQDETSAAKPPLDDLQTKIGIEEVISKHIYRYASNTCDCGRQFADHRAWAKHLRIRIWRYLQNDVGRND